MYGAIARLHVKPEMQDAFLAWAEENASQAKAIAGHVETLIYELDAAPHTLMLVLMFESRGAYEAWHVHAEPPAPFQAMRAFLAAEPEWHDGEAAFYLGGKRGDGTDQPAQADRQPASAAIPSSQVAPQPLYGTVARFRVKPGMRSLFRAWANYSSWTLRTVPGIVNSVAFQVDDHAQEFMIAVVFESREAYRANADSPEQHTEYLQMMEFLVGPPEWNNGAIIWHD